MSAKRQPIALRTVVKSPAVALSLILAVAAIVAVESAAQSAPARFAESVSVRLFELYRPTEIRLTVKRGSLLLYSDEASLPLRTYAQSTSSTVRVQRGFVEVQSSGSEVVRLTSVELVPSDSSTTYSLAVTQGARPSETRLYSGSIRFSVDPSRRNELLPVNSVDLETYVAAVTTSEYGLDDTEGNMAMAVLARTYALRSRGKFGEAYDHVDHSISQVYHGIADLNDQALAAARRTAGQVLVYGDALVEALYHAESGGHTADNESVWTSGNPVPYLRGVRDPYANKSPYAEWSFAANRGKLLAALSRKYGGTVTGIRVGDVGKDGRVKSMELLRRSQNLDVPANEFRILFLQTFGPYSMKSTLFTVSRDGNSYRFNGRGFGHGVGLSQWGAHEMAVQGHSYRDILAFYFRGTTLAALDDITVELIPAETVAGVSVRDVNGADEPTPIATDLPQVIPMQTDPPTQPAKPTRRKRIGW